MFNSGNDRIKSLFDVKPILINNKPIFSTVSMQRSGQHAIIRWLAKNMEPVIHLNHCVFQFSKGKIQVIPLKGRCVIYNNGEEHDFGICGQKEMYKKLSQYNINDFSILYSFEDLNPENKVYRKFKKLTKTKEVFILRDPLNWLASTIKHKDYSLNDLEKRAEIYIKHLKGVQKGNSSIIFNKWLIEDRAVLFNQIDLGIPYKADVEDRTKIQSFGGGSSFSKEKGTEKIEEEVLKRWKLMKENLKFKTISEKYDFYKIALNQFDLK